MTVGTAPLEKTVETSARAGGRVPLWLAAIVLLLFVAVLAAGGFLAVRTLRPTSNVDPGAGTRLQALENLVRERPGDVALRSQLAFAYQQAGRTEDALREYERVLAVEEDDLAALYNTGLILLASGKNAEGERALLRVLEIAPSHDLAAKTLAEYYAKSGRFDRVVAVAAPAAQAHPELADLQYLAGLGFEKTGRTDEAAARYKRALELIPSMTSAREALDRVASDE